MRCSELFAFAVVLPLELVGAIRLSLHGTHSRRLHRRGSIVGSSGLSDGDDITYSTNLTLGGTQYEVQIDTGSSDLYVASNGNAPNSQDTGKSAGVQYAVGSADGPVRTADLDFLGYTVSDQAFIQVNPSSNQPPLTGLIGLGPSTGSSVRAAMGSSAGDPVLDRIFRQNTSASNYITFLLGREEDPSSSDIPGNLTIGEILPGYENITNQPKIDVSVLPSDESDEQHWQVLLDADGILGPDGSVVDIQTVVSTTSNKNQLTVVLDTGYSLPQVPSDVAKAFYGDVPDARLVTIQELEGEVWQIPCNVEINITFKFGGVEFPIHPLDTNAVLDGTDGEGGTLCYGAFQPNQNAQSDTYDMIFGMSFLRNAYVYINYGDFVDGSTNQTAPPYVQMLPTTNNSAQAHSEFEQARGNSANWNPKTDQSASEWIKSHLGLVIGIAGGIGLLLLGLIAFCCRRNSRGGRYAALHEPVPPPAYDLHLVGNRQGPPGAHPATYGSPWDARY